MCAMMEGLPVTIECRDQSVPRQKAGSGSTAGKEAAPLCSTHSGLGGGAYSVQSGATILPGCCPQLAGSNRISIPVPPKSAQVAPRHRIILVPPHTARKSIGATTKTCVSHNNLSAYVNLKLMFNNCEGASPLVSRAIQGLSWLRGPAEQCLCSTLASRDSC